MLPSFASKSAAAFAVLLGLASTSHGFAQQKPAAPAVSTVPAVVAPAVQSAPAPETAHENISLPRTDEDFTTLSLEGSDLEPQTPINGAREENKDFIREMVRVQWRIGDPIDLYIVRPVGVKNPPVALYLLSYPTSADRFLNPAFCKKLVENGVAAVGFTSALTAERFARRPFKQWFVSQLQESLTMSAHDAQEILNYLATRGDVDTRHVGFFGMGSGATIAALAVKADARIQAVDLIEPWGDWKNFLAESKIVSDEDRPNFLKPEFLKNVEALDPVVVLPELKGRAVRALFVQEMPAHKYVASIEKALPATAEKKEYASELDLRNANGFTLFKWIADQVKAASVAPSAQDATVEKSKGESH